jgi:hypothetical protein
MKIHCEEYKLDIYKNPTEILESRLNAIGRDNLINIVKLTKNKLLIIYAEKLESKADSSYPWELLRNYFKVDEYDCINCNGKSAADSWRYSRSFYNPTTFL